MSQFSPKRLPLLSVLLAAFAVAEPAAPPWHPANIEPLQSYLDSRINPVAAVRVRPVSAYPEKVDEVSNDDGVWYAYSRAPLPDSESSQGGYAYRLHGDTASGVKVVSTADHGGGSMSFGDLMMLEPGVTLYGELRLDAGTAGERTLVLTRQPALRLLANGTLLAQNHITVTGDAVSCITISRIEHGMAKDGVVPSPRVLNHTVRLSPPASAKSLGSAPEFAACDSRFLLADGTIPPDQIALFLDPAVLDVDLRRPKNRRSDIAFDEDKGAPDNGAWVRGRGEDASRYTRLGRTDAGLQVVLVEDGPPTARQAAILLLAVRSLPIPDFAVTGTEDGKILTRRADHPSLGLHVVGRIFPGKGDPRRLSVSGNQLLLSPPDAPGAPSVRINLPTSF